ncbi:MAG: hypothetical protein AB8I08_03565 [Sandaracinaceae bacterium]
MLPTDVTTRGRIGAALLGRSLEVLRDHPIASAALGGAVLLSIGSTVFGVGMFATPWFMCELFALQLAVLGLETTPRGLAWLRAGLLALAAVGLVVAATAVAALFIGPDVSTADGASGPLPWPDAVARTLVIALSTAMAAGYISPFLYAPVILLERGGTTGAAAVESAWLVSRGGPLRHVALAFAAHLLPLVPALAAAIWVARTYERAATPVGVLLGLPLLTLTIPLGQGLVSAAYAGSQPDLPDPRWTRVEGRPPRPLAVALFAVVAAPVVAVVLVALGASRPSPMATGAAAGEALVDCPVSATTVVHVPDTTLTLDLGQATLTAGDGGGVGPLVGAPREVRHVRVLRRADRYAIELEGDSVSHLWVNRAAVRVDDTVRARLSRRMPAWGLPSLAIAFLLGSLLMPGAFGALGAVRRVYGTPLSKRTAEDLPALHQRTMRRAWKVTAALAIPAALSFSAGVAVLFTP